MSFGRKDLVSAPGLVIAGAFLYFVVTLWLTRGAVPLPPDTVQYAEVARSLVRGLGYTIDMVAFHPGYYPEVRHVPELHGLLQPLWFVPLFRLWGPLASLTRIPGLCFVSALAVVTFTLGRMLFGNLAGVIGAAWILTSGGFLFMALTGADDVGAAFFSTLAVLAFLRALEGESRGWLVVAGLAAGVATLEKLTGIVLPVVFGVVLVARASARRAVGARGWALLSAPACAAVGLYLARNHLVHGGLGFRFGAIDWASKSDPLAYFAFYDRAPTTREVWASLGGRRVIALVLHEAYRLALGAGRAPWTMIGGPLALAASLRRRPEFAVLGMTYVAAMLVVVCVAYHFEPRYLSVLEPLYAIAVGGVLSAALDRALALAPPSRATAVRAVAGIAAALLVGRATWDAARIGRSTMASGAASPLCDGTAAFVRAHVGPRDVVVTSDPGLVVWSLDRAAVTAPTNYERSLPGVIRHYGITWALLSPRALGTADLRAALQWLVTSGAPVRPQLAYDEGECTLYSLVRRDQL